MGNIHIMPSDVIGRIAAGEVVERPASVLKELVENSMDAKASMIRVNVEQGGHKLVQVIDNGCGMDRSDALMCLEAHATSKISCNGDVGHIATLGFRGEAIPSIASVSRFDLQTRRAEDAVGTEVVVDYGIIRDQRDCGCAPGTNIRVQQLFGNLPARRKFLKGPETEEGYIEEMVRLLALARPDVTLVLYLNGREAMRTNATSDIGQRVASILGRDMFAAMLPVDYAESDVRVRGFVTTPGFTRSSKRDQRIIINGRAASAETVFFAIRDSYESLVMKGRYPGAVLYIDLPADRVDVNVHPTKREVRFREMREVGNIVAAAIRRALRQMPGGPEIAMQDSTARMTTPSAPAPFTPELDFSGKGGPQEPATAAPHAQSVPQFRPPEQQAPPAQAAPAAKPIQQAAPATKPIQQGLPLNMPPRHDAPPAFPQNTTPPPSIVKTFGSTVPSADASEKQTLHAKLRSLRLVGRLGTRYALVEGESGLVVLNIRAAHQRIIFEKMLANMKSDSVPQQQLLLPVTLSLGADDVRFMKNSLSHFLQLGFQIEPFGGNAFIVSSVPAAFDNQNVAQMVRDIIDDLRHSSVTDRQSTIHVAQAACRHAVSANAKVSDDEIRSLIHELSLCEMPYACPNGHPTMVHITYSELEKRFLS